MPDTLPPFPEFMCTPPTQEVLKKGWFRGTYLTLETLMALIGHLYENGAILGRRMQGRVLQFEQLLGNPREPGILVSILKKQAAERRGKAVGEPSSFFAFVNKSRCQSIGIPYPPQPNQLGVKLAFKELWTEIQMMFLEGIGFGLSWPDLTRKMYVNSRESIMAEWSNARSAGVKLPECSVQVTFEEQEETMMQMTRIYVTQFMPSHVSTLGF